MLQVEFRCGLGRRLVKVANPSPGAKRLGAGIYSTLTDPPGKACAGPVVPPTATVRGEGTQSVTVALAGFPSTQPLQASVSYSIDAGPTLAFDVTLAAGLDATAVAAAITTDGNWPAALTPATTPTGFTADAGSGKVLSTFELVFTP